MRTLELSLALLIAATLACWLLPPRARPASLPLLRVILAVLAAIAFQLHALLEAPRWQLVPAYLLGFALLVAAALGFFLGQRSEAAEPRRGMGWLAGAATSLLGLALLACSVALATLLPVTPLPAPSGPHPVGVARFQLDVPSEPEPFTPDPADHRVLVVEVYYPASPEPGSEPRSYGVDEPWASPIVARATGAALGRELPGFLGRHLSLIESHSYPGAPPLAEGGLHPTLVFSHGYALATLRSNSLLLEDLASHGYVVASIGHSYETPYVVLDDGRVLEFSAAAIRAVIDPLRVAAERLGELTSGANDDPARTDALVREFLAGQTAAARSLEVWTRDTAAVVDALSRIDAGEGPLDFLAGRLDLRRLGVLGMSFGGATAAEFCLRDTRCRAGLNLDGFLFGHLIDGALQQPFMLIESDAGERSMNAFAFERLGRGSYHLRVRGSLHGDFTDSTLVMPILRHLGLLGGIDGAKMIAITNACVRAFFDRALLGRTSWLLESPAWPELELTRLSPGTAAPGTGRARRTGED